MVMVVEHMALQAAGKGLKRVMQAEKDLREMASAAGLLQGGGSSASANATAPESFSADSAEINDICEKVYEALCDDLNTPVAIAHIFDAVRLINSAKDKKTTLSAADMETLVRLFDDIVSGVLGLKDEEAEGGKAAETVSGLMDMILARRKAAKDAKDWATSDRIRDELKALGITIKDTKEGTEWTLGV